MTPIQEALRFVKMALWGQITEEELGEQFQVLLSSEQEEIELAWIEGNKVGWAMESDWPHHATEYYAQRFDQAIESHPKAQATPEADLDWCISAIKSASEHCPHFLGADQVMERLEAIKKQICS